MGSPSASIFVVASLLLLSPSTALSEDQRMEASTAPPSGGARRRLPFYFVPATLPGQEAWTDTMVRDITTTRSITNQLPLGFLTKNSGKKENGIQPRQYNRTRRDQPGARSPAIGDAGAKGFDGQTQTSTRPLQDSSSPGILVHSVRVLGDTDHSVVLAWRVGPINWDMRRSHGTDGIIGPTEEIRARDPDGEREGRTENEEGGSTVKERGTGRGTGRRGRMGAPGSGGFSILYARLGEQQMRRLRVPPDHTRATVPGLEPYAPYVACVVTRSGIGRRWQHMPRREQCVVFSTDEAAHAAGTQRFINAVVACVAGVISAPLAALLCCSAVKRRCRRMYGQRFQGTGRCGRGKGAGGEGSRNVMLEGVPV
ncbi:uncharacterized protein LOC142924242 isoform X1 [Petromyzon marinus]|uniref:uncharacterized protein LOC142924242 isoform X1 n=1 Tax=Petromyzon marinus TaxID=7757 RepID=UPI003F72A765